MTFEEMVSVLEDLAERYEKIAEQSRNEGFSHEPVWWSERAKGVRDALAELTKTLG